MHVRGYPEEGTTTTPFDMVVRNQLDRFHLAIEVIDRVPGLAERAAHARQHCHEALDRHERYIVAHGVDMPEVEEWRWQRAASAADKTG
jgi:xylulose-5-phosphate/fructose-6-phosphate phosphoketolase